MCAEPAGTASAKALRQEGARWAHEPESSPGSWRWGPGQVDVRGLEESEVTQGPRGPGQEFELDSTWSWAATGEF